jgi:hypothetical protein
MKHVREGPKELGEAERKARQNCRKCIYGNSALPPLETSNVGTVDPS